MALYFLTPDSFAIVQMCQYMHSEQAKQSKTAPIPKTLPVFEDGMLVVWHAEIFIEKLLQVTLQPWHLWKFPLKVSCYAVYWYTRHILHLFQSCVYMYSISICQLYCYIYCYFCFYTLVYCIQYSQFHWIQRKWMHLQFRVNLLTLLHLTKQVRFGIFSSAFHPIKLNM